MWQECPPSSALPLKTLHIALRDSPRADVAWTSGEIFRRLKTVKGQRSTGNAKLWELGVGKWGKCVKIFGEFVSSGFGCIDLKS